MKIAFNPSNSDKNILDLIKNNKDIIFDLKGHSIFARGVEFKGTDTWRPVVDNLISDSTTSSLSANQGRVLAGLINGHQQIIDMRNYDGNYWHPVTVPLSYNGYNKIKVSVQLNSGDKPSWATHDSGFTCNMEIWATAHGWGTTNAETICLNYTYGYCNSNPCGWKQLGYPSLGVLFLRGGARYKVWTDFDATFTPHDKTYTWTSENGGYTQSTGGPYTSCPGLDFIKNKIYANLDGSASYLEGGSIPSWGTLTAANGFTNVSSYDYGSRGAYGLCGKNTALYMQLDGYFYQNEGKYRVIDTSDFNWTNLPGKLVGNEFNIVNAGFNNRMWFNYLPIDNRNSSAAISQYIMGNGNKGLASVYAYRFKVDGKSCMWKDARNYAPFYATFNGGFEPILDIKTKGGDWSIGSYDAFGNHLVFAFTSDSDFNAGVNGTAQYWLSPGGEFKINTLRLAGPTSNYMGINSTNPQIIFAENSTTQQVALTYTDWDTYRASKGLKVHSYDGSDDSNVWFEVQGYNYSSGYVKNGSSNAYVLLGGGGHKPLSEFQLGSSSYLPYNGWWSSGNGLDVNNANGMIFAYANHKNSPFSSAWGIITTFDYTYNSDYKFQLAANGYSNAMYYRSRSANRGGWTSWAQVIDTGNISSQRVSYATSAGNADTVDGYHANSLLTALSNSNNGISITVGGTTKSVSNISVNYAASAGSASSATQATNLTPENTPHYFRDPSSSAWRGGMYWGNAGNESMSFVVGDSRTRFQFVGGSDIANWTSSTWQSVTPYLTIYSSGIVTPGSVTANNWFRSQGASGWYSETYGGGIYMTDTSWIRTYGDKPFYCDNQIYSSNSIRMSNIYLQNIDEINNGANGALHLNYRNSGNITLCNGGGAVTIGTTSTDIGGNKLYVNGSEFINGASNVKDHVFANGFRHRSHNSNDSVLLAGGGYSQGVPVKYWSIEQIIINSSEAVYHQNRGGNYTFITKIESYIDGACTLTLQFPSGYDSYNTMIWAMGRTNNLAPSDHANIYATIIYLSGSKYRLVLADDSTLNNGSCQLYFMCF